MGKKIWGWGKIVLHEPAPGENPFLDRLTEWMDSPEGQLAEEARDTIWPLLDAAQIDASRGVIIWPDAQSLDIQQTVHRIHEDYPHLAEALIEDKVIAWLEMAYAPNRSMDQEPSPPITAAENRLRTRYS